MVNWYAVSLAVAIICIIPKKLVVRTILNWYKYKALNVPPNTVIVILDDIGMNYEKARAYAKRGARIIIGGKDQAKTNAARKELIQWSKNKDVIQMMVDRHDKHSLRLFAEQIMKREVAVNSIINNAGKELSNMDIIFTRQELAKERFENHCVNFLYSSLPDCDL